MQTLDRAFAQPDFGGRRIALPWRSLETYVKVHTQELVQVIGAPGSGKSTFAINLAMGLKEPVYYIAQDTPNSVMTRMAALATGKTIRDIQGVYRDPEERVKLAERIQSLLPTLIMQKGTQTTEDVRNSCLALAEWLGQPPAVVLIDNLIDLTVPGYHFQEPGFYATALPELKQIAIDLDMAVVMLHHVTKIGKEDGQTSLTINDVLHAGARESRHVWGIYHSPDQMFCQILKNQDGPASGDGKLQVAFKWVPESGKLLEA